MSAPLSNQMMIHDGDQGHIFSLLAVLERSKGHFLYPKSPEKYIPGCRCHCISISSCVCPNYVTENFLQRHTIRHAYLQMINNNTTATPIKPSPPPMTTDFETAAFERTKSTCSTRKNKFDLFL